MRFKAVGLKAALVARGTSVTWLAERLGIKRQIISYIVNGTRTTDAARADAIANALKMPRDLLFEVVE